MRIVARFVARCCKMLIFSMDSGEDGELFKDDSDDGWGEFRRPSVFQVGYKSVIFSDFLRKFLCRNAVVGANSVNYF